MLPSPLSSSITPSSSAGNWDPGRATPARLRAEPCKPPRLLQGRSASPAPSYPHLISHVETHYRFDGAFANAPSASAKGRKRKTPPGCTQAVSGGQGRGDGVARLHFSNEGWRRRWSRTAQGALCFFQSPRLAPIRRGAVQAHHSPPTSINTAFCSHLARAGIWK